MIIKHPKVKMCVKRAVERMRDRFEALSDAELIAYISEKLDRLVWHADDVERRDYDDVDAIDTAMVSDAETYGIRSLFRISDNTNEENYCTGSVCRYDSLGNITIMENEWFNTVELKTLSSLELRLLAIAVHKFWLRIYQEV